MVCMLTGRGKNGENHADAPVPTGNVFQNLGQILQDLVKEGHITQVGRGQQVFIDQIKLVVLNGTFNLI